MFNITSKYFGFLNNKPPASRVVHIIMDFLECYSCCIIVSYFNKIIKRPGITFQFSVLSQKYVTNICSTAHKYLTKFHIDSTWNSKEINISRQVSFILP